MAVSWEGSVLAVSSSKLGIPSWEGSMRGVCSDGSPRE